MIRYFGTRYISYSYLLVMIVFFSCNQPQNSVSESPKSYSGIYPHLAMYNQEDECGTGAVIPWAGSLWVITYAPHKPLGSTDKLYEVTPDLEQLVHMESVGGTAANRMVHLESQQLFIGPYIIDEEANVRVIPYEQMQGRHTGNARHLNSPEQKIYYATMEEGFYEVDVNTLQTTTLYQDLHDDKGIKIEPDPEDLIFANLPGAHGKGLYSGQGVLVYANNGEATEAALQQFDIESGVLAEWDGSSWKIIRRNQFVEVTGPGGIYGNTNHETDPIWTTGWDHKSVLVGVRENSQWSFYRLPKSSHSYDGAHGWNTEWPRIRDIGTAEEPDFLMTMHGMFWEFPASFSAENSQGIRPRSSYLKVIGDFTRWNQRLVFGCDDSALREFLNKRKVKGGIEGPGQSNSNLWFTSLETPDHLGPVTATGAVWLQEPVKANVPSEAFLFSGWPHKIGWLSNHGSQSLTLKVEVDIKGDSSWETISEIPLGPSESKMVDFDWQHGEWIRLTANADSRLTAIFNYTGNDDRSVIADSIFRGINQVQEPPKSTGLIYGLGENRRALGMSAQFNNNPIGYYELGANMKLVSKQDPQTLAFIDEKFAIPEDVITEEEGSLLVVDDQGRRWRLPKGDAANDSLINNTRVRISREVATERDLFNCHGTFYELPAENADGFAKIRPIASHPFRIHDYASYRGLLVMTGIDPDQSNGNQHIIISDDRKAAVWVGAIDDLWKLGKPTGSGGPWFNSQVSAGETSDPYLIGFYDHKELEITHDASQQIMVTIEIEALGHGPWMTYKEVLLQPGRAYRHVFPKNFQARWIRFRTDRSCKVTTWLEYQ